MIKMERIEVNGFEGAIRGMRNAMNSWDKSDSFLCEGGDEFIGCAVEGKEVCLRDGDTRNDIFCIGSNDLELMRALTKAGTDHAKFMRFISVSMDIVAPLYWWKEFDTYKVGTASNSCSTMHKIHDKEFTLDDFSTEHLINGTSKINLQGTINLINQYRCGYIETNNKEYWWQMIQLLPSSYNQRRTIVLNYQVLRAMHKGRRHHKLDEWQQFCDMIEQLPYFNFTIGADYNG